MATRRKVLPKAKGISRIDDPTHHGVGWYARVTFRGKTVSKYFADGAHGGTDQAFEKALEWRNATERQIGKPRTDRVLPGVTSRSRTGISGVYRSGSSYVVAWTPEEGGTVREFVSISKYGEEGALKKAVEMRRRYERSVYGRSVSRHEDAAAPRSRKKTASKKARPAAKSRPAAKRSAR